jgi:glycosyltransferase involved in cell wall biosynthesis
MKITKIYYFHNLDLTFKSAQTIQIIKDYFYLSKFSIDINIYGTYQNESDYQEILKFIANSKVNLIAKRKNFWFRFYLKMLLLKSLILDDVNKILVTRHYKKLSTAIKLKYFGLNINVVHEMHEESFPYLFKNVSKNKIKLLFLNRSIDNLIFTNYSQVDFFKAEFGVLPEKYVILPNGVETSKLSNQKMQANYVLTYVGQFNKWKNIDIMFHALSKLDKKYCLKIAGGKGNLESKIVIDNLIKKHKLESSRVTFLGYIDNENIPNLAIKGTHLLLLPLGDNIQSMYLTSPMKLFEYMSTRIPVLAIGHPSVASIASGTIFLSKNDVDDFATKIKEICEKNEADFDFDAMNKVAENYSYTNRSKKYYRKVINGTY